MENNVLRGYFLWPKSIKHYGPTTEFGTRSGSPVVRAIPKLATIISWLVNSHKTSGGHSITSFATREIARKIIRNIAISGIPSNLTYDNRGFVRAAIKTNISRIRGALRKQVIDEVRKFQIFPLRVIGPKGK